MPPILLGGPGMFRKALAIYAAAFVVVAIIAKAAIVGIGLPDWVFPGSLIVMALGLPVVLWTGYVQRVTRRAIDRDADVHAGRNAVDHPRHDREHRAQGRAARELVPHRARRDVRVRCVRRDRSRAFMVLRAFGIGPFGSLLAAGPAEPARSDSPHRLPHDERRLDARARGQRRGARRTLGIVRVHARAAAEIVSALARMKRAPSTRVDSGVAREIAQRSGMKAIVDGDVTGVPAATSSRFGSCAPIQESSSRRSAKPAMAREG